MILKHHPLSDAEVRAIVKKPITVIKYSELDNYNNMEDLFKECDRVLLLYESKINSGHWTCLINQPKQIVFFDPYSLEPDSQLAFTNIKFRESIGIKKPYLSYLMYKTKKPIDYNNVQLQVLKEGVETCGYWCAVRMMCDDINNDRFNKAFKTIPISKRDNAIITLVNRLNII